MKHIYALVMLLLAATAVHAQTFTVTPATGSGPKTASWDVPNGTLCQAGGDWSGAKAASGTQQITGLAAGTHNFTLTCTVPGTTTKGTVKLSWTPATENTDGTPYTDAKGYEILYGKTSPPNTKSVAINNPATVTYDVANVDAGSTYFAIMSVNSKDVKSDLSGIINKVVVDVVTTQPWTGTATADVTLAKPKAPVLSFGQ